MAAGNSLVFTLPVAFKSPFSGTKNLYLDALDFAGAETGWMNRGSWTVQ